MDTRGHASVGPATERIAEIDDHFVSLLCHDRSEGKIFASVLEFQATQAILEEESDDPEVGVWPCSFDRAVSQGLNAYFGIV